MTHILELACGLMLLVSPALGGAPSIFCRKPLHKFGNRSKYEKLREPSFDVPFIIENRGDTDLIITKIRLTCGSCTEYRWGDQADTKHEAPPPKVKAPAKKIIPPGKKEKLAIAVSVTSLLATTTHDFHDYRVIIHSNDPEKPLYILRLRGNFVQDFSAPQQISLGNVRLGKGKMLRFHIQRRKGAKSDIVDIRSSARYISAIVARRPTGPASLYTVQIALFKHAPAGIIDHRLVFRTKGAKQKSFVIPLTGKIIAEVDVSVERILFGPVSRKTQPSREIFITQGFSSGGKSLQVLDVKTNSKHFSIETETVQKGKRYRLLVKIKPDAPVGTLRAKLIISTNKDGFKTIEIPVFALVRE